MSTELMEVNPQSGEITPIYTDPTEMMRHEISVAKVARQLIENCTVSIQGQRHLKFEGWCGLARLTNCMISTESVKVEEDGVSAIAVVKDLRSGEIIGRGEGFVGHDELVWFGGETIDRYGKPKKYNKRPMAAIRAFAQTRAGARAARMAMSSLVTLMGKEYSPTPAEEMPHSDEEAQPARNGHHANNGHQPAKEPATEPAKAPAVEDITIGPDGRYPSLCTQAQIDNLKALVVSTKSDGKGLFAKFGDPRKSTTAYTKMLAHLNGLVAAMEGGKEDEEVSEKELPF